MPRTAIFVADGVQSQPVFELLDGLHLTNSYTAQQYADREVLPPTNEIRLVSLTGEAVRAGNGRMISVDDTIKSGRYDLIYVAPFVIGKPEQFGARLEPLKPVSDWIAAAHAQGTVVAASGSGVGVLARAGVLQTMTVPVAWWLEGVMARLFPQLTLDTERSLSVRNNVLIAGRHNAEPALVVRIIARIMSPDVATFVERVTGVAPYPDGADSEVTLSAQMLKPDPMVAKAAHWLQLRFAQKPQLSELSEALAIHPRTLSRRFVASMGMTPVQYLQALRLEAAKRMLARSDRKVDRVAYLVGYSDPGFFKTLFQKQTGLTPGEYRRQATNTPASELPERP
jgi:transcriptional regulator GlxA family with amidase domain